MKRRIVVAWIGAALAAASCGAPVERSQGEATRQDDGWTAAPRIKAVERHGASLIVRGDAPSGSRVVLRDDQDAAFAAGVDGSGRFELRISGLDAAMLLAPEVQVGQFPAPGPERLLITPSGDQALAALLIEGGPSRRLSPGPVLDSVDDDGRGLLASGRAPSGTRVVVSSAGVTADAVADASGRWTALLAGAGHRADFVEVAGVRFDYPGPAALDEVGRIERAGAGWRLTRAFSASARQTSWFPDV